MQIFSDNRLFEQSEALKSENVQLTLQNEKLRQENTQLLSHGGGGGGGDVGGGGGGSSLVVQVRFYSPAC